MGRSKGSFSENKGTVILAQQTKQGTVLRFTISIDIIDYQWCNFYIEGSQNKK